MMPPRETDTTQMCPQSGSDGAKGAEAQNPADLGGSELLRDQIHGVTTEHAIPARLEDEGQSGG